MKKETGENGARLLVKGTVPRLLYINFPAQRTTVSLGPGTLNIETCYE